MLSDREPRRRRGDPRPDEGEGPVLLEHEGRNRRRPPRPVPGRADTTPGGIGSARRIACELLRRCAARIAIGRLSATDVALRGTTRPRAAAALDRALRQAQLTDRLAAVEEHRFFDIRTPSSGTRGGRRRRRAIGASTCAIASGTQCGRRRRGADRPRCVPGSQQLLQRHVRVGRGCSARRGGLLGRQQVARGDVAHVDQVEAGVDVGGEPAGEEVDDDLPCRRRLDVAVADGCRGADHHHRQPRAQAASTSRSASSLLRL